MDWAKAKTILIVVLLIFCCALGGILMQRKFEENEEAKSNVTAAENYLSSIGVECNCTIPTDRPSMGVLFVEYSKENANGEELTFEKYKVYTNVADTYSSAGYSITGEGESKAKVVSASSALIEAVTKSKTESVSVVGIELCYYINSGKEIEDGSSDTAVPAWRIETNSGYTYILAY